MTGFLFFLAAVLLVGLAGLALHFIVGHAPGLPHPTVTRTEWLVGTLVASLVVIPTVTLIGGSIAKASAVSYQEYWSGLEKAANKKTITCTKDGPCTHEYSCDPYVVMVTKTRQVPYTDTETYTDANGNTSTRTVTKYRTETYQEPETRWRDCPYVTHEYTFTVEDTMGETYTLGRNWFPPSPQDHRWTGYGYERRSLPNVPTGEPKEWVAAKERIAAGNPGGTTKRHKYDNYILASSEDIYEKHSTAIEDFKSASLLPPVQTKVYSEYRADKVYFAGVKVAEPAKWQEEAQRLNGYLGSERQGDLHTVVVGQQVTDIDSYAQALAAYWQGRELEKNTLSKNGIGLVLKLSADGTLVEQVRAFTGMPMGNEALMQAFSSLEGSKANPTTLMGKEGAITKLLLEEGAGFERIEMAEYEYLADSVQISTTARVVIFILAVLLSFGVWGIMFAVDLRWRPIEHFREFFKKEEPAL